MSAVGFIGLGRMGAPMATQLLGHVAKNGGRLLVYDISPEAVSALVAEGAEAAGSAAENRDMAEKEASPAPTAEAELAFSGSVECGGSGSR